MTMNMLSVSAIGLALFFATLFIIALITSPRAGYTFRFKKGFMMPEEQKFLTALDQALDGRYRIFAKVHMTDILRPKRQLDMNPRSTFKIFATKRLDYVVCDKESLDVLVAIELDGKNHRRAKTKLRDRQIDDACASTGLKLVRFDVQADYDIDQVRTKILHGLEHSPEPMAANGQVVTQAA